MIKLKKIISSFIIIIIILNTSWILAKSVEESDVVNLVHDHDCISLLKVKEKNMLKGIAYVCYIDPDTNIKYPAFCVEPANIGVGSGAGESYDVKLSQLDNPILWRILYKGYVGSSYKDWGLETDDDLYYATKTAVHCFAEGSVPVEKYEIPHRVGYGENISLEEVRRRAKRVLEVTQELYDYGFNGSENYKKAELIINFKEEKQEKIDEIEYLVKTYEITANKELSSYNLNIKNFPEGTRIIEQESKMKDSIFKIAIPIEKLTKKINGIINITNAKVKAYPIFYGSSGDDTTQDYVLLDATETSSTNLSVEIEPYISSLKIIKIDKDDNRITIPGVKFDILNFNKEKIAEVTTNEKGEAQVLGLIKGKYYIKEIETDDNYVLNENECEVIIKGGEVYNLQIENEKKKGQIEILKTSSSYSKITEKEEGSAIENVKFGIYDEEGKLIEEIITDKEGKAISKKLDKGKYKVKEIETDEWYILEKKEFNIEIKDDKEIVKIEAKNKPKEPGVDIEKRAQPIVKLSAEVKYDFEIKNTGNVPLNNFTWYDFLPYENSRITKLYTGTYNQNIKYNIYYKTNKKNEYLVLKKNLSTKENSYINLSMIYLEDDEYITEIKVEFGSIGTDFKTLEKPLIYVKPNSEVPDGTVLINNTILEGTHQNYKVCDEDETETVVENKKEQVKKLPRTGY